MSCPTVTRGAGSQALGAPPAPIFPGKGGHFVSENLAIQQAFRSHFISFKSTASDSLIQSFTIHFYDSGATSIQLDSGNKLENYLLQLDLSKDCALSEYTYDFNERKIILAMLTKHNTFDQKDLDFLGKLAKEEHWENVIVKNKLPVNPSAGHDKLLGLAILNFEREDPFRSLFSK